MMNFNKTMHRKLNVILLHNIIAPYRLPIFEEINKSYNLEVFFCETVSADRKWSTSVKKYEFISRVLKSYKVGRLVINFGLWKLLRIGNYDVFILADNEENILTIITFAFYAKIHHKPLIVWNEHVKHASRMHENSSIIMRFEKIIELIYRRWLYKKASAFLSMSGMASDAYLLERGVSKKLLFTNTQIAPVSLLVTANRSVESQPYLLYIGYFRAEKNLKLLLKAYMKLTNPKMKLVIVGGGPEESELKRISQRSNSIEFVTYVDETKRATLYKNAVATILPSLYEPWGLVVNESLYYGTPVLCSDRVSAAQLIQNGINGLIFKAHDFRSLLETLIALTGNVSLQHKLKKGALNTDKLMLSDAKYGITHFKKAIDYCYEETLIEKVLILQNSVSPYRLPLFQELSKHYELTVCYGEEHDKKRFWALQLENYTFHYKVFKSLRINKFVLNAKVLSFLRHNKFDYYIITDNTENMLTIFIIALYARLKAHKPFIIWSGHVELNPNYYRSYQKNVIKIIMRSAKRMIIDLYRFIIYMAATSFISYSKASTSFLTHRGISKAKIYENTQIMPSVLLPQGKHIKSLSLTKINLLYLGYMRKEKGLEVLIRAFSQLDNKRYVLHIVGSGDDELSLKKIASTNKNIHFYPYAETQDRANWYKSCDVFVFPTFHDPWAHVITEALFYGLPVISSSAAGASMLIKNGVNGYVINPNSENEIIETLKNITSKKQVEKLKASTVKSLDRRYYSPSYGIRPFVKAIGSAEKLKASALETRL